MAKKNQKFYSKLNYGIVMVAVLFIFLSVNSLSIKRYYRMHMGLNNTAEVSEITQKLLKNLPGQVQITFYIAFEADPVAQIVRPGLERLVEEYRYLAGDSIKLTWIDPYVNQQKALQLVDEFSLDTNEDVIIVQYDGKYRVLRIMDMAEVQMGNVYDGQIPRLLSFKGEQLLSSAIYGLISGPERQAYFTTGHGEYDPLSTSEDPRGYSMLTSYIRRQNVEIQKIALSQVHEIPENADLLVIAGPKAPFQPFEIDSIKAYLNRGGDKPGRLILLLDPQSHSGMEELLTAYGVKFSNDMVMREITLLGEPRILVDGRVSEYADHPATSWIGDYVENISLGISQSLEVGQGLVRENLTVTELLKTSAAFWGETNPREEPLGYQEERDKKGPLTLAVLVDAGSVSGGEVQLNEMKALAMGSAGFLVNQNLSKNIYNVDLFLNAMNWMLGKEELLGIAPKTPEEFTVELTPTQYSMLFVALAIVVLGSGGIGMLIWLRR
ncbi:MAG: GldG family protein [Verrucomicrobiota bacterium]